MRQIILAFFLFIGFSVFSQIEIEYIEKPNIIEQKHAIFYKNSWKPFNGNILLHKENPTLIYKGKVKNGIEYYTEVYGKNNKLIEVLKNGIRVECYDITLKSKFKNKESFKDISDLNTQNVKLHYNQDFVTKNITKLNGIVKFENKKYFYSKGILTKIETYYDENCNSIKDSHEIFSTELGNLSDVDLESSYHGNYKLWNKYGKIVESGKFKMGKKIK